MPFSIVRNDITKMKVHAIVNAANTDLKIGGGVCGAVFNAAGERRLQAACEKLAPIKTGEAVATPAFALPAKYIIHTAGPIYKDGKNGEEELLRSAYTNSLNLALKKKCKSIAFPLLSSGAYGYPKEDALHVATEVFRNFLSEHDMDIYLVVFDKSALSISKKLLYEVKSYIDERYVEEYPFSRRSLSERAAEFLEAARSTIPKNHLPTALGGAPVQGLPSVLKEDFFKLDESFSETLFRLIDAKGKDEVEVYKRANIDRKLFSKIRSQKDYTPSKRTVIALAVGLELSIEETDDLLKRAGYALSQSKKFDVIVEYFITNEKYDIIEINTVLFDFDQQLLGA
jgi:O-acetyl-ADP-ribose deacetylase (regulator of RNase III)